MQWAGGPEASTRLVTVVVMMVRMVEMPRMIMVMVAMVVACFRCRCRCASKWAFSFPPCVVSPQAKVRDALSPGRLGTVFRSLVNAPWFLLQDIDWVQTEKHVFEQASSNPFLVGLHSCFQTTSR